MVSETDKYRKRRKKKRRSSAKIKKPYKIILLGILLISFVWGGFELYEACCSPSIEGEWISKETGLVVEFTKMGQVKVNHKLIGDYHITGPGQMIYNIEDQEFNMHYKLSKKSLKWGIADQDHEIFERKHKLPHLKLDIFS